MKKLATAIVLLSIATTGLSMTIKDIGEYAKRSIKHLTPKDLNSLMKRHIVQMRLMDENGRWASPELSQVSDQIVDPELNVEKVNVFIDKIVEVNSKNEYLLDFMKVASTKKFATIEVKLEEEGHKILPDVITFALVLDNMTTAMRNDWRILESTLTIWPKLRKKAKLHKLLNLFEKAKLASVESPVKKIVKMHSKGKVDKNFLRAMLPLNIWEAILYDYKLGSPGNAKTGKVLAKYNPNDKTAKKILGNADARFSDDGNAVLVYSPESEKWADLYEVWNLGFVAHYKNFPYVMSKLVIPSVAGHQGKSEEYLYNRVISLYLYLNYTLLGRLDGDLYPANAMNWYEESLYKLFGTENIKAARDYEARVEAQL